MFTFADDSNIYVILKAAASHLDVFIYFDHI